MVSEVRNVVLLSIDALRADHCSCYGYERETTPRIDAFAGKNDRFENAYSASSHTREAIPALLTGRYPDEAVDGGYRLATDSIATHLGRAGFSTAGFHSNPFVSQAYGFDRGFDTFDDDLRFGRNRFIALAQRALDIARRRNYARAGKINERSLAWLDSLRDSGSRERFFLWNHYMDVHGPYEPPAGHREFASEYPGDREVQKLYKRAIDRPDSVTEDERRLLIDCYDAEIRCTDQRIGAFLDALDDRGLLKKTLVVLTADHGDAFGEHGYYEHPRYLHEELLRVPLLVGDPSVSDADGGMYEQPVSTLDIVPTLLEAVGVSHEDRDLPGRSLRTIAADGANGTDRTDGRVGADSDRGWYVFGQAHGEGADERLRRFSVRDRSGWSSLAYDLDAERVVEERPRSGGDHLLSVLREHVAERAGRVEGSAATDAEPSEEIERRLEALGYRE
jgi:arylsulfatase